MNKILLPQVKFKELVSDEKRIVLVYSRIFKMAKRRILEKRQLTGDMSLKYTDVQYEGELPNNRRGGGDAKS